METHGDSNTNAQTSVAQQPSKDEGEYDDTGSNTTTAAAAAAAAAQTIEESMNHQQDYRFETTISPPAAPTKPQLRRRLFEKLRTKRNQIITQHRSNSSNDNDGTAVATDATTGSVGSEKKTTTMKKKPSSLVTHYYRVDTVPRKSLQNQNNKDAYGTAVPEPGLVAQQQPQQPTTSRGINEYVNTTSTTSKTMKIVDTNMQPPPKSNHTVVSNNSNNNHRRQRNHNERVVNVILPGVPSYEEDWARDTHDYFNLIVLVPVTVLNIMNWNWDILFNIGSNSSSSSGTSTTIGTTDSISFMQQYENFFVTLESAWTGDWFMVFFYCTAAYFIIDLLWIIVLPICVKSPSTIIQHHVAVLLYIIIPLLHTNVRYWMGACMTVEINTWFLIARRVFNKQGFPPWTLIELNSWLSIRVKVISIFFYVTWISIRCILYPALLLPFYKHWRYHTQQTGTNFNIIFGAVALHAAFCLLNLKWSYELLMSKIRYFRRQRILYKQHLRQNRNNNNNNNNSSNHTNGKFSNRYNYQPDPSISQGL